ncbi:MAG: DNA polymerase/3'-5' exonuclease PolX [Saprospiraceae bacterium]|nr:DNA polymerase/3'-5' exonuclease PolX [Saprospiraceae bacterium]
MTNKEIANAFQELGNLMELHQENPFKIRSYQTAYINLRKLPQALSEVPVGDLAEIKGVGKAIAGKITELLENGKMETLEKYRQQTPAGIRELLQVKGFGPKKVRMVWKELGVESVGELLYAVNENRLIELNGFGAKTQEDLRGKLEYFQRSQNKYHFAALEAEANEISQAFLKAFPNARFEWAGALRRKSNILDRLEFLTTEIEGLPNWLQTNGFSIINESANSLSAKSPKETAVQFYSCQEKEFGSKWFRYSASKDFMDAFLKKFPNQDFSGLQTEEQIFDKTGLPFIQPELREQDWALDLKATPDLLEETDIKGVIHSHSTYSDGVNTLREMAESARDAGYEYLGISDHSKSAFYANGLQPERVLAQMEEIDQLNVELAPFRILKSIESDILNDGSLDYETDILERFDFIIASVHSNLRMDEEKATQRLITAVENPYTNILGHPTGRLLLSREGYPIDHKKVIDACAANGVAIELNANPYRLDLDWTWIPYAMEKGVWISINPDAHSTAGIRDIHFGVLSARKGGLNREACLNATSAEQFLERLRK